jgi:YHS domain-containing protein
MIYGLLRILFFGLIVYFAIKIIRVFQAINKRGRTIPPAKKHSGIMVKDNICNTYLPKDEATIEIHQGKEYFFCSDECRKKFLQAKKDD